MTSPSGPKPVRPMLFIMFIKECITICQYRIFINYLLISIVIPMLELSELILRKSALLNLPAVITHLYRYMCRCVGEIRSFSYVHR